MTVPKAIQEFLLAVEDISFNYSELNFYKPDQLKEGQIGYSVDSLGKSLVEDSEDSWKNEWVVIASDNLGDPVFVDINSSDLHIMSAAHGMGSWEPFIIARTLKNFRSIISGLQSLSIGRTNPSDYQKNPLTTEEKEQFLEMIRELDPEKDSFYWESFIDIDEESDG